MENKSTQLPRRRKYSDFIRMTLMKEQRSETDTETLETDSKYEKEKRAGEKSY